MAVLPLLYAPNAIFKQKALAIDTVDDSIRMLANDMLETMEHEKGVGLGANMVGILKRIAVVDLHENNVPRPYVFINPVVTPTSDNIQTFDEASLSFPGISAKVTRPADITVSYTDINGHASELHAEGFLATVIQHEVDYLDGIVFIDKLSKLKRDRLLKKMIKAQKLHACTIGCCH